METIAIASDHAGFEYEEAVKSYLASKTILTEDFGIYSLGTVDYTEFVRAAARAVVEGQYQLRISLGGSGNEATVMFPSR